MLRRVFSLLPLSFVLLLFGNPCLCAQNLPAGQDPLSAGRKDRITQYIDDERRIVLRGQRHPLATPEHDAGAVAPGYRMEHMILTLQASSAQQVALEELLAAQQDPDSSNYHQWLTPQSYGQRFGVSESDLAQIVNWLRWHGMSVEEVTASGRAVIFSGTAAQVEAAFHTPMHTYQVAGQLHHANAEDPEIPEALAEVVTGVVSLHDFRSQAMHLMLKRPAPAFTIGSNHYLAPADFATIYDLGPLYQQGLTGSGQSIAVVGRSNIHLADVRQFRSAFGLAANDPQVIVNGTDPGIVSVDEEVEADLDVQWAGALASSAAVKFVVSASTNASDGAFLSAQYIVNRNLAPVLTMSFGLCEPALGSSGNSFINSLWQQAASQGMTVFVASGDDGAAGCDSPSETTAQGGHAVNGLCSTPYSVCVGGTEFNDAASPSTYWSSSNASGTQASALSYIPEIVWNESGSSGLWASGGGVSSVYAKPSWQAGPGVPADGHRDVPDVSLTAAGHDGYLIYLNGGMGAVGGTSAATPSLAGIMALVLQGAGARVGNADATFYALASRQDSAGGAAVFHDITNGNNSVPGQSGYSATPGYDLATGLGSVDAYMLVHHWSDGSVVPALQLNASASSVSFVAGSNGSVNLTVNVSGGFNAAVAFSVSGVPSGVAPTFTPAQLLAPGSGTSVLKLMSTASAQPGTYTLTVSASGGGLTKTANITLTILPVPMFTLTISSSSATVAAGGHATVTVTTTANATFNAALNLSASGLPSGMTASFSPASISAPGSGRSTLTLSATTGVAAGAYTVSITAAGGGVTQTGKITVNVPGFVLSATSSAVSLHPGGKVTVTLTTQAVAGFNAALALSVTGAPRGVTASLSPQSLTAPGSGTSTLTVTRGSTASVGSSTLTVAATGGGVTKTVTVALSVTSN